MKKPEGKVKKIIGFLKKGLQTTPGPQKSHPSSTQPIAQPNVSQTVGLPGGQVTAPGGLSKKNQQWFAELEKSVMPIRVVPPPVPGQTFVPGFPVTCNCVAFNMMTPKEPNPNCKSCGGKGFVIIAKG